MTRCAGALCSNNWNRTALGRGLLFLIETNNEPRWLHGLSRRIVPRVSEKQRTGSARPQILEQPALLTFLIGSLPQRDPASAEAIDLAIRKQQVLWMALREIAVGQAADEERSHIPLAGLVCTHHMDGVGAVVSRLNNSAFKSVRGYAPELFERDRLIGVLPEFHAGLNRLGPRAQRRNMAAGRLDIGVVTWRREHAGTIKICGQALD